MNEANVQRPQRGSFFRYTLLPGFMPRTLDLFTSGFRTLAFFIANILGAVRILPRNHVYLQPQNYQKFGLISVLAEGARCVTWDRKHIDQVAVYLIILTAFMAFLLQFILLGSSIILGSAFAGPNDMILDVKAANSFDFFFTPAFPEQDYALRVLDLVFGLQNLAGTSGYFESCVGIAAACNDVDGNPLPPYAAFPTPMHAGFHSMIHFYNYAIIALAFVILFYYVVTMLAETTVHGTFWGQRGNKTWIPVRVIFFLALIMPFYQGFNLAQIITLDAAYFGTGMASNAWREFNDVVSDEVAGDHASLLAIPNRSNFPSSLGITRFMSIVKTCRYAEQRINGRVIDAYVVKDQAAGYDNCRRMATVTYTNALDFSNNEDVRIRFGQRVKYTADNDPGGMLGESVPCTDTNAASYADMPQEYSRQPGYVIPYCGEIIIPGTGQGTIGYFIRAGNYNLLINNLWSEPVIDDIGQGFTEAGMDGSTIYVPDYDSLRDVIRARDVQIEANIINAVNAAVTGGEFDVAAALEECGWMCAALYYNRIAEANGIIMSSIFTMPDVRLWPATTEVVMASRNEASNMMDVCDLFNPLLPGEEAVDFSEESNLKVATIISNSYEYFCTNDLLNADINDEFDDAFRSSMSQMGKNPVIDIITTIFGVSGLFDMREQTDVHPLAQLSILGKGMVESTIVAFGGAGFLTGVGALPIANSLGQTAQSMSSTLAGVATSLGMIGLTIGFILYYVLPYLPFIYFMFAAANWFKAIFEAMVGLPLWALAHLRLDGEGIIGDAASDGYWLILEIFLRPFLILCGFLASISIFMGMVKVLNDMFDLVVANIGGFNATEGVLEASGGTPNITDPFDIDNYRAPIDQFFYTVIYAIIVYMLALSCFKLIDYIPNFILRWAGLNIKTFGDFQTDHSAGIMDLVGKGITASAILGGGSLDRVGNKGGSGGIGSSLSQEDRPIT